MPVDLSYIVGLKPEEAIHYFESKGIKISFHWQDVWREQHARAFTVAGVAKQDLLDDIRAATATAIAEGQSKAQFRQALEDTVKRKGWWGKGEIANPETGEIRKGERGSAARLNLIYRQNTQSAYNAGRWKQQQESAAAAPYLRYVAIMDQKTRPGHKALHGRVYRHDDPFWDSNYPPNGWNCRCRVEALSEWGLKRRKLRVERSSPADFAIKTVEVRDPATGKPVARTVRGYRLGGPGSEVFYPDVGFDYNPGQTWLQDVLAQAPTPPQAAATNWQKKGLPSLRAVPETDKLPPPSLLPAARTAEYAERQLAEALGFTGKEKLLTIATVMGTRAIRRDKLAHMVEKRLDARERFANYILPTLQSPYEVWLVEHMDGKLRENYIGLFRESKYGLLVIVRVNRDGSLLWNVMQRDAKGMDRLREGWLVYQKS